MKVRLVMLAFPLAALLNSFSMTALLVVFGVFGDVETAADIGIVQGATLALFYAFSANARYLILTGAEDAGRTAAGLLRLRLMLVLPLAVTAWFLSVNIGGASEALALILIVRRAAEWMGEIGLASQERLNHKARAFQMLVVETTTLFFALLASLEFGVNLSISAIPWAFAPLLAMHGARLANAGDGPLALQTLLPHFGSTAIIGASVYVFRISIALLVGKALAGALFTAFAIGGLIPTVFSHALAPTLMRRYGAADLPRSLLLLPAAMFLAGSCLTAVALASPEWLSTLNRPVAFWMAAGLSVIGGAVMLFAVTLRARLINRDDGRRIFGPDLLANVLIATCVPFIFYVFGARSLAGLYLLSACFSLVFLWGGGLWRRTLGRRRAPVLVGFGALVVVPVFVQINGGLFNDPAIVFDTLGSILLLPIPVSIMATFCGIVVIGNYASATRTLTTLFFSALLFVMTSLAVSQGHPENQSAKLILLAQFLLPIFGLAFGEIYGAVSRKPLFERAALAVLVVILPLQLLATWLHGGIVIQPKVFLFSIYQHLEYFPMVVAALVVMTSFGLWRFSQATRFALAVLLPLTAIHLVASGSISAFGGMFAGLFAWLAWQRRAKGEPLRFSVILVAVSLLLGIGYMLIAQSGSFSCAPGPVALSISEPDCELMHNEGATTAVSRSLSTGDDRSEARRFYLAGALDSPRDFLLGHATRPDRSRYPSAHNYWLDTLYNLGMIALLPLIALLIVTGKMLWQKRNAFVTDPLLVGTTISAAYLILVEGMLNVGMRQPYPGTITFFIWGLLLARLHRAPAHPAEGGSA